MPELVKQTMLSTDHPSLEFRGIGQPLARLGKWPFDRDKMAVQQRQRQGTLQRLKTTTQAGAAGIGEVAPHFIQTGDTLIAWSPLIAQQAPTDLRTGGANKIAQHSVSHGTRRFQAALFIDEAAQTPSFGGNVQIKLQALFG
ncbi:hypothetical protein D3C77_465060 [compost metagenome]